MLFLIDTEIVAGQHDWISVFIHHVKTSLLWLQNSSKHFRASRRSISYNWTSGQAEWGESTQNSEEPKGHFRGVG